MNLGEDRYRSLVDAVSDGDAVDWDGELAVAPAAGDRAFLSALRVIQEVRSLHQSSLATVGAHTSSAPAAGKAPSGAGAGARLARRETLAPGRYGHLEILERIGGGAFGDVYRARDARLDREVAVKLLAPETPAGSGADPDASAWLGEARRLASVRHPNVVLVHAAETIAGRPALVMELIRGRTLAAAAREQGRFGAHEAAVVGLDLCRALAAVHHAGLLHQDLKAQNVMREEGGRIVLMDFGPRGATPIAMAPELFRGEAPSARSDVYGLGVLLYHLTTGTFPVAGRTLEELRAAHVAGRVEHLRDARPDLPAALVSAVDRALAAEPAERWRSAGEFETALAVALGAGSTAAGAGAATAAPVGSSDAAAPAVRGASGTGGAATSRRPWQVGLAALAACAVIGVAALLARGRDERAARAERPAPPPAAAPRPTDVTLFRGADQRQALASGARVAVGDSLSLRFAATESLYVYVVNEDERGEAYLLFPLAGLSPGNPIPPGQALILPGTRDGRRAYWQVTSAGGREHVVVLASRARLIGFEKEMLAVERPEKGRALEYPPIGGEALRELRGVGGYVLEDAQAAAGSAPKLYELADSTAAGAERASAVWMRQIELENPDS